MREEICEQDTQPREHDFLSAASSATSVLCVNVGRKCKAKGAGGEKKKHHELLCCRTSLQRSPCLGCCPLQAVLGLQPNLGAAQSARPVGTTRRRSPPPSLSMCSRLCVHRPHPCRRASKAGLQLPVGCRAAAAQHWRSASMGMHARPFQERGRGAMGQQEVWPRTCRPLPALVTLN